MTPLKLEVVSFTASFMTDNFTLEELKVILAYNKTSAGRKAIALMPQMMGQLQVIMQKTIPQLIRNFQASMKNKMENTKKNKS
ncbi:MAG: DUF2059 domain-containing protein [Emcibacter sp.]|nr:DUF2059 domain-containing protein [Emcibacter sp.]